MTTSKGKEIGRREIVALHILVSHNRAQMKRLEDENIRPERVISQIVPPTTSLWMKETGTSAYNAFVRQFPVDTEFSHPEQVRRVVNNLQEAGFITKHGRIIEPTDAGIDFVDAIVEKYGESPYTWPYSIFVVSGVPDWQSVVDAADASAEE